MLSLVEQLSETLRRQGKTIALAESCTGGMIAAALTELPGSSQIFERGFVTYSNDSKHELLNVSHETLSQHGAVSQKCATEMAQGALNNSHAALALSVTGIAGPTGGSKEKPVGLVYIGYATREGLNGALENQFAGNRDAIREQSLEKLLETAIDLLESKTDL